jgi:hypothetical protein
VYPCRKFESKDRFSVAYQCGRRWSLDDDDRRIISQVSSTSSQETFVQLLHQRLRCMEEWEGKV